MKGLKTLIKLSRRQLDTLRRQMADLQQQKDDMRQAIANLQREMIEEMQSAQQQPHMSQFYGGFASRIRARQEEYEQSMSGLDTQMDELRDTIRDAFAEIKRYELALEAAKQREKQAATRRETIEMDDIAATQFVRKEENK